MAREEGLATQHQHDSKAVREIYREWSSSYDDDTERWGYEAPVVAASLLAARVPPSSQVLDVGCGTGKVGAALAGLGYNDVVGVDVSGPLLDIAAATGHYRALGVEDLTALPTSLLDESFAAVVCVGVFTYLEDVEAICRELCRLVEPDGIIVVTQRTDLFASRNTEAAFDALSADGTWKIVEITEPRPYLPNHDEYSEIGVRYGVFERQ